MFRALREISIKFPIGVPTIYKTLLRFFFFMRGFSAHIVIELPSEIDIKDLIEELKILCWEASDVLLIMPKH